VALNSVGELRLSNGLNNLIQALKMKIKTQKNTLLRHLDFGLGVRPGVSVADIDNGILLADLNQMIQADPRFDGIDRMQIRLEGPKLEINLAVRLAGNNGVLPITFDVPSR
jgi:hypothetical protein